MPSVTASRATACPPNHSTITVASTPRNSIAGRKMNDRFIALMLASRLASLTWLKRSWLVFSCPKAWMTRTPEISSARSPTTLATEVRVRRKAPRARLENHQVASTISGSTVKASSAR